MIMCVDPTLINVIKKIKHKINVFIWRMMFNRLPTRRNFVKRGIDVELVMCPCCNEEREDGVHLFLKCSLAVQLWHKLELDETFPHFVDMDDLFKWIDAQDVGNYCRVIIDTVCLTLIWVCWTYINAFVFANMLFDSILSFSFIWFCNTNREAKKNRNGWMQNPFMN